MAEDLQTAAQVVRMVLIKDHSRMKFDTTTSYNGTLSQQHRLQALSHRLQDWAAASPEFRAGAHLTAQPTNAQPDGSPPDGLPSEGVQPNPEHGLS